MDEPTDTPIETLPLDGWHALQLQGTRKPEWLTCSEPPVFRPAVQMHLWRAA